MNKNITIKINQSPPTPVPITTSFIRLDAFLKLANAVESGGQAKLVITEGKVRVNGEPCTQRGKKLRPGDEIRFAGQKYIVIAEKPAPLAHSL